MLNFKDLQDEVKQRATRNQGGTYFDSTIKNIINTSLFRLAREAKWRCLRRKTYFPTITSYTSGTNFVSVTQSSTAISLISTACDLWTDKIEIGRRVKFGGDGNFYYIRSISSNTSFSIDLPYRGVTTTRNTYEILPQDEYSLPIQVDHRAFLWHEDFGYPYRMFYVPDQTFYDTRVIITQKYPPTHYRMWGENYVKTAVPTATPICVVSDSAADTSGKVIIFGDVSGSPNYEEVNINGTTTVTTSNLFTNIERVAKNSNTTGKITVTSSRGSYEIVTLPAGDTTAGVKYSKVQIFALPTRVFNINVHYYKDPYRLVNDDDVHEMGQEFDEAILLLSVAKIKYQENQQEGDKWFAMYKDELVNLRMTNIDKIDWTPILKRPSQDRTDPFVVKNLLYRQVGPSYGPQART
jgi:hypothetical protein